MTIYRKNIFVYFFVIFGGGWLLTSLTSCGKSGTASPQGINVEYQVLNLSPDLFPVDLFIDNKQVNVNPFVFNVNQGYFYLPSIDVPFQFRSAINTGTTLQTRGDLLKSGVKYTLFIVGTIGDGSDTSIFTVDTAITPALGRGKIRFVNASPSATGGLDVIANGTPLFNAIVYQKYSAYTELPVGNYDLQIDATGTTTILSDQPTVTIQDGRLYTLYAYGYTSRTDSAAFASAVITNK